MDCPSWLRVRRAQRGFILPKIVDLPLKARSAPIFSVDQVMLRAEVRAQ
jgi:hypothetical protein